MVANIEEDDMSVTLDDDVAFDVGYKCEWFFSSSGWYQGEVQSVSANNLRRVLFEDGKMATMSTDQLICQEGEPTIREVGFRFCRKF